MISAKDVFVSLVIAVDLHIVFSLSENRLLMEVSPSTCSWYILYIYLPTLIITCRKNCLKIMRLNPANNNKNVDQKRLGHFSREN